MKLKGDPIEEIKNIITTKEDLTEHEISTCVARITYDNMMIVAKNNNLGFGFFVDENVIHCKQITLQHINEIRRGKGLKEVYCKI